MWSWLGKRLSKIAVIFSLLVSMVSGQVSTRELPYSAVNNLSRSGIPVVKMPPVDVASLLQQDAQDDPSRPWRFGYAHKVSLNLSNSGKWVSLADDGRLWRLSIKSEGAYSINLVFDVYSLAPGAKLWVYKADGSSSIGAFTSFNNKDHGKFATVPVPDAEIVLELYEPAEMIGMSTISVSRVVHAYREFQDSKPCNINVMCSDIDELPYHDVWADTTRRSVAMILLDQNTRLASGALINNAANFDRQYFLTAKHVYEDESDLETMIFAFNYESSSCYDGSVAYFNESVQGAILIADHSSTDVALFELLELIPEYYNVYYAGWTRWGSFQGPVAGIHHPRGDIKKISYCEDAALIQDWSGNGNFYSVPFSFGVTEPGSSGSPANATATLLPGESLTIPAGSELDFPDGFTLQIEGELTLDGSSDPIVLNALNNSWNGIVLGQPMNNHGSLFLNNVEINDAQTALTIYQENAELINLNEIQINDCATGIDLQGQGFFNDALTIVNSEFISITSTAIKYSIPWLNGGNIAVKNCTFNQMENGLLFHYMDQWGSFGAPLPSLEVSNCRFSNFSQAAINIEGYEESATYWPLETDEPEDFDYSPYYFHDNTFTNNGNGTGIKYIGNMPLFVEHCLFNNLDKGVDLSGIITCGDGVSAEYNRYLFANNTITKCTKGYDLHFDGCSSANRLIFSVMETTYSIFYGNTEDITITDGWGAAAVDQYSHFSQDADPQFVDFNGDDFHLTATSPCVDQVDWQGQGITYFDPVNRVTISEDPDGTPLDQGAFYYPQLTGTVTQDISLSGAATLGNETGGDVIIPAGFSLTVEPGTEVHVHPDTRLVVNGSLYIQGEPGNPVFFTTEAGAT